MHYQISNPNFSTQPPIHHQHMPSYTHSGDTQSPWSGFAGKVKFPKFNGTNARDRVVKANKYFMLNLSMDTYTKIVFASLYLEGPADHWFQLEQPYITWETFIDLLLQRWEFSGKIQQTGSKGHSCRLHCWVWRTKGLSFYTSACSDSRILLIQLPKWPPGRYTTSLICV